MRTAWGIVLLLCLTARAAWPQAIEIRLLDDSTRTVVPGAIVRLLGAGTTLQALSDARGRVLLVPPAPGSYRIRVDRIGFIGMETGTVAVAPNDTVRRDLVLPSIRLALPTIEVREESPCEPSLGEGSRAAALWEDIRKALTANVIVQREGATPLRIVYYERPARGRGEVERILAERVVTGQPFQSVEPEVLSTRGFVHRRDDSVHFSGPDAALLISDEFVRTHCYRVRQGRTGQIGLAFEPVPNRGVPDIRGTLWVDRRSSQLQSLEFSYVGMHGVLRETEAGGRVHFRKLANGGWIVDSWLIRTPIVQGRLVRAPGGLTAIREEVAGHVERGGRVEGVGAELSGTATATTSMVEGTVYDSIAGTYLAGVMVRLSGLPDSVLSDSTGTFRMTVFAEGARQLLAVHPRLGLLPDSSRQTVVLIPGRETVVEIAVPPISAFVTQWCPGERGQAGLLGVARARNRDPADVLSLRVSWIVGAGPSVTGVASAIVEAGPNGEYALCRLPANEELTVRLRAGDRIVEERRVTLRPGEFRWTELLPPSP